MKEPRGEQTVGVSIKGTRQGLVVTVGKGDWPNLMDELGRHLERRASFFNGAQTFLDTGGRNVAPDELKGVQDLFSAAKMKLCGIQTTVQTTAEAAARLEIPVVDDDDTSRPQAQARSEHEGAQALFLRRTIRSGQSVWHPGHVTILGDVNPGAQVVATGDIVIWGKLRGTVHAGAQGDDSALVCALVLTPTQLRIANHIAKSPEEDERDPAIPEVARVDDRGIVVEPWNLNKRRGGPDDC